MGPMVQCRRKAKCSIRWFHWACVGYPVEGGEWACEGCVGGEGREGIGEEEGEEEVEEYQHHELGEDGDVPREWGRVLNESEEKCRKQQLEYQERQQEQEKQQQQQRCELEGNDAAAPPAKRVRFCLSTGREDVHFYAESREDTAVEQKSRNAEVSREQRKSPLPYCFCGRPDTEEMVACDGDKCPMEWFHFSCVELTQKTVPRGKWFCEECGREEGIRAKHRRGKVSGRKRKR